MKMKMKMTPPDEPAYLAAGGRNRPSGRSRQLPHGG
jgi:hypothetical protein